MNTIYIKFNMVIDVQQINMLQSKKKYWLELETTQFVSFLLGQKGMNLVLGCFDILGCCFNSTIV